MDRLFTCHHRCPFCRPVSNRLQCCCNSRVIIFSGILNSFVTLSRKQFCIGDGFPNTLKMTFLILLCITRETENCQPTLECIICELPPPTLASWRLASLQSSCAGPSLHTLAFHLACKKFTLLFTRNINKLLQRRTIEDHIRVVL